MRRKYTGGVEPDGHDTWTYTLGSALNHVRTWTPEDSGSLPAEHEFTYSGKGVATFSAAGSSSEEKIDNLQGQSLEVSEHSGSANIKIRDDPFDDVPFGVRPTSDAGSSLDYGDAAVYAIDAAVGVALANYKEGLDIAYDGARVVSELLDTGGDTRTDTSIEYSSSHSGAEENESYVRFRTRHDYYYDSEIKLDAAVDHPNSGDDSLSMYVYFPNGTDAEKNGTSTSSTSTYTEGSRTPKELQQEGYKLLSDSPKMKVLDRIPAEKASKNPYLREIGGGGAVRRVQYPVWAKVEANSQQIHLGKDN